MLNSSDKFIIQHFGGDTIVKAKTSDKTQHLTDLIKRQKSKPPKKKLVSVIFMYFMLFFNHTTGNYI